MDLTLIFTDYTIRNVALGALVLGIVSGTLSAFAVLRKQSLLGDAMSHAALPGIVVMFMLTGQRSLPLLMVGAIVAGWLGTLFMQLVTSQTRIKQDAAQGVVLAVFFGFGMALLSWVLRQNNAQHAGLDTFLFGKAAATVASDVTTMALVGAVVLVLVALFWKEFKLVSFDRAYAATLGFPVTRLDVVLTSLIVVVVVVGLQMVGVVLMSAMLVAPGVAARQWTNRLGVMVPLSALFGALAGVGGALTSSFENRLPTGPVIVLFVSALVLFSLLFAPERGMVWDALQRYRNSRRLREAAVLETLYRMAAQHGDPTHPHSVASVRALLAKQGVRYTLEHLAKDGLVREVDGNQWALTEKGVESVRAFVPGIDAGSRAGMPATEPKAEVLA